MTNKYISDQSNQFKNKIIIVTGSTQGSGAETAKLLASRGAALAESMQIKVVQRHLTLDDLSDMTECFLTGTAAEVTPVSQVGDHSFTPADVSRQLVDGYENLVRRR